MAKARKRVAKPADKDEDSMPLNRNARKVVESEKQKRRTWLWLCLAAAVLAVFLAPWGRGGSLRQEDWDGPEEKGYQIMGEVPRLDWQSDAPFARRISHEGSPVVLSNTVAVARWPALARWTEDYMRWAINSLNGVYRLFGSGRTFFFYDDVRPFHGMPGVQWERPYETVNVSIAEFFDKQDDPDVTMYYVSPIDWFSRTVVDDASPIEPFSTHPDSKPVVNLWMGHKGVTSSLHYDPQENFYVQVKGRKKFILFPPDGWRAMYTHPCLHPEFRQSQIDANNPDLDKFPRFAGARAMTTILNPGDVLYLPPYWWHRVIALDLSFSVNIWTRSHPELKFKEIFEMTVPFGTELAKDVETNVLTLYTNAVIEKVLGEGTGPEFVTDVLHARYSQFRSTLDAAKEMTGGQKHDYAQLCAALDLESDFSKKALSQIDPFAEAVATELASLGEVSQVLLADWVEELSAYFVGHVHIADFLFHCHALRK